MESDLRQFPTIERVIQSGDLAAFLERCAETCRRLDEIARGPEARLSERARSAMTAYGHTIKLLQRLTADAEAAAATAAPASR
jgi:hypothetical protein